MDALINNASSFYSTPLPEISNKDWDKLIGSNLKGPLFITKGLAPMLEETKGSVINITDINIDKGLPGYSIYSAAKGGLKSITKGLAKELAPNIRVNAVAPGAILEPPGKSWSEEELAKIVSKIPLNRIGDESDIANTVKFIVDSRYITGQTVNVDGGRSLA
jgi:pteridine reductase